MEGKEASNRVSANGKRVAVLQKGRHERAENRNAFRRKQNLRKQTRSKCGLLQQARGKLFKGHEYISRRRGGCSCTSATVKICERANARPFSRRSNVPVPAYCLSRMFTPTRFVWLNEMITVRWEREREGGKGEGAKGGGRGRRERGRGRREREMGKSLDSGLLVFLLKVSY